MRLTKLPSPLAGEGSERVLHLHGWRGRATEAAELLIWQAHARPEAIEVFAARPQAARLDEANAWFAALEQSATKNSRPDPQLRHYTLDLVAHNAGDQRWLSDNSKCLSALWVVTGEKSSPPGLWPEHLQQAFDTRSDLPLLDCRLVWLDDARNARSAYRLANSPDYADLNIGFRFPLRS